MNDMDYSNWLPNIDFSCLSTEDKHEIVSALINVQTKIKNNPHQLKFICFALMESDIQLRVDLKSAITSLISEALLAQVAFVLTPVYRNALIQLILAHGIHGLLYFKRYQTNDEIMEYVLKAVPRHHGWDDNQMNGKDLAIGLFPHSENPLRDVANLRVEWIDRMISSLKDKIQHENS